MAITPSFYKPVAGFKPGKIIKFQYLLARHDPYPCVLTSDLFSDNRIAGLNIRYLTFPIIAQLLKLFNNKNFNYYDLKPYGSVFLSAYRSYKLSAIRVAKELDTHALITTLRSARKFTPAEIDSVIADVRAQIQQLGTAVSMESLIGPIVS